MLDIPAHYLDVYRDGATGWARNNNLVQTHELSLVKSFEFRFKPTASLPCNSVKDYPVEMDERELADESEDEVDLVWADRLNAHFEGVRD